MREDDALTEPSVTRDQGRPGGPWAFYWRDSYHGVLVRYADLPMVDVSPVVTARWKRPEPTEKGAFRSSWRSMLASWNVLQFLSDFDLRLGGGA